MSSCCFPRPYNAKNWIISEADFKLCDQGEQYRGKGHYGQVYRAFVKDQLVAAKKSTYSGRSQAVTIEEEFKKMRELGHHPHILRLVGIVEPHSVYGFSLLPGVFLVTEFCFHGDLHMYLRDHGHKFISEIHRMNDLPEAKAPVASSKGYVKCTTTASADTSAAERFTTNDLIKWAFQIASGMKFLSDNRVAHNDLALRNVLVTVDKKMKIGDFGLAKRLNNDGVYQLTQAELADMPKWSFPPEFFDNLEVSTRTDIWAFSLVLLELFSLARDAPLCDRYKDLATFKQKLMRGYRPALPAESTKKINGIIRDCWMTDPELRPSFLDVKRRLKILLV